MIKSIRINAFVMLALAVNSFAQTLPPRPMENLGRSIVVQGRSQGGTFLTWRMLGTDPRNVTFNLFRDGTRLTATPITGATNFTDTQGNINARYRLETIFPDGRTESSEQIHRFPLSTVSGAPVIPLMRVPIPAPPVVAGVSFEPGYTSVGDLDGDGIYELIYEWTPSTNFGGFIDAITLQGRHLWRIALGPNVTRGKQSVLVWDLNGDGRAEVSMYTGPGTRGGTGQFVRRGPAANFATNLVLPRGWSGELIEDPQFVTVFNGLTGAEMATDELGTRLGPLANHQSTWGDGHGHRAGGLKGSVLYTRQHGHVLAFQRGIYTRIGVTAYRWDGANSLTRIWNFDTEDPARPDNRRWRAQGHHAVFVGDINEDGDDDHIFGAAAINGRDGRGLWSTQMGHGDAGHLGKHIPDRPGLQMFSVHENPTWGASMIDARTGKTIWAHRHPEDVGRGWAADVDPAHRGSEVVAHHFPNMNNMGVQISTNFNIFHHPLYFDGEVVRAWQHQGWGINSVRNGRILTGWHYGASSIEGTREAANLIADILGDWREEFVIRHNNNREFLIFSSWFTTVRKNPTLMHDPTYRKAVVVRNVGRNVIPHTGYFFGDGYPDHNIYMVGSTPQVCVPTALAPWLRVNNNAWQESAAATLVTGDSLALGPHPTTGGAWSWAGCGTSGTARVQVISPTANCVATATHTNACGASSTQQFTITVNARPSIVVTPVSLNFGGVTINQSSTLSYAISATNLAPVSGNIVLTAPTAFTLSHTETGTFTNTVNVAYTAGALAARTIWVRFSPTQVQAHTGNITNVGGGALTVNLALSGAGQAPPVCNPTVLAPWVRVNTNAWLARDSATIIRGDSVALGPHPTTGGAWSWAGCGTSGTARVQVVSPTANCVATATHTNACGTSSTQRFIITMDQTTPAHLSEATTRRSILVYSNANSQGNLKIRFMENMELAQITIYDLSGQLAYQTNLLAAFGVIDLNTNLQGGIYTVRIKTPLQHFVKRVVVLD